MPPLFWLDIAALCVSLVVASALVLMALESGPHCALTRSFALFALLEASWAACSLLLRLALWLDIGNPALLLEAAALAFAAMGPVLLVFSVRYVERSPRWADPAAAAGLVSIAILSIPLFRHQLIFNPQLDANGTTFASLSNWGVAASGVPALFLMWALILFWQERRKCAEPYLIACLLALLTGLAVDGVLEVRFPLLSLTNSLTIAILGYAVLARQLLNSLKESTAALERRVEERTKELEQAYLEVESRVDQRTAALRREIVERERIQDTLRQRTAQLEALRQGSLALAAQLDLETLLYAIVSQATALLKGTAGGLYLYRPEREVLEWCIGIGPNLPPIGSVLRRGEGLSGKVWETGDPLIVNDYQNWEGRSPAFEGLANTAAVGALVRWGNESLGVLNVLADLPRTFSPDDAELLTLFALQAAIAIRNARLYEEARSRGERLAVVNHIAAAVGTTLQLGDLLETVYREITPIFQADAFSIALYDEQADELEFYLQVDGEKQQPPGQQPLDTALASLVIAERKPVLIRDLDQEQDGLPRPPMEDSAEPPRSRLGVPMQIGERLIGTICMQAYRPHAFGEEDQQLLSTIADQVALAVERARLYQTIHDSEQKYRALFEQANDAVFLGTLDGRILDVNEKACQLLGYERQDLLDLTLADILPASVQETLPELVQKMIAEGGARLETESVRKDGSRVAVEVSTTLLEVWEQDLVLALVHDITERRRLEAQLRQAQKMEALGTLAGGIAHDFNNILTGILGYASLVRDELQPGSALRSDVETIVSSAERASELTQQLLTFARQSQAVERQPIDLNLVVFEVVRLLERTIDKAISIQTCLADDLQAVQGNASQLHQMLLNLCLNARDAMPQGGQILIETRNECLDEEGARLALDLGPGSYVVLSVTDTGEGMSTTVRERIFEPFFTTKEHGRGLGLAMVYGIVRGHSGAIHVYSEPAEGTTFRVYLPAYQQSATVPPLPRASVPGGSETVLVVDDEETVRNVLRRMLERAGYRVLLGEQGLQAADIYRQRGKEIDLVILDVIMPGMGGKETFDRLREINPQVKVLLSSGYSENGQAAKILAAGAQGFLQKPYDLNTVLRKVRQTLDA